MSNHIAFERWNTAKAFRVFLVLLAIGVLMVGGAVQADPHPDQSVNVAVISSTSVINGGAFPTNTTGPTGSFTDFHFYTLAVASVGAIALGPGGVCGPVGCDTVLLNVASSGMSCSINRLSAAQKADLVSFVYNGGKLIIYDSECSAQDYSWLPFPFTTSNPGAQGARGTLTITEENYLSTSDPADIHYVNAVSVATGTDAVGDMNVMTTFDPNWYLDMSGTNVLGVTGPVHTYALHGAGVILYNGLDVDYMNSGTAPTSASPAGNLAKIWLQELQVPFNPTPPEALPGGVTVVGITLTPASATNEVGQDHTVTPRLTDLLGAPQPSIPVAFSVTSGPNAGTAGTCSPDSGCTTDANGEISFTYTGVNGIGTDEIQACFSNQTGQTICSQRVTKEWIITNEPPVAEADGPYTVEEGGAATLDGSGSWDPDGGALTHAWDLDSDGVYETPGVSPEFSAASLDGPDMHTVGLQVCDPDGLCDAATATVEVTNVPPAADAGMDQTVFRNDVADLVGSWTDPAGALDEPYAWTWDLDGDGVADQSGIALYSVTIAQSTVFADEGVYMLTFGVTDKDGGRDDDSLVVIVLNRPPDCSGAAPSRALIWPVNHQFVPVQVMGVTDPEGDPVAITITGIWQDEPVDTYGDGRFTPDGMGVGMSTAQVRAERAGTPKVPGNGRVYHIYFSADDGRGGVCMGEVRVAVPHDQNKPAVDDGALFDSTLLAP